MKNDSTVHYSLRIPVELRQRIAMLAKTQRRSAHAQAVFILEEATKHIAIEPAAPPKRNAAYPDDGIDYDAIVEQVVAGHPKAFRDD